jgi:hypothetical protein
MYLMGAVPFPFFPTARCRIRRDIAFITNHGEAL